MKAFLARKALSAQVKMDRFHRSLWRCDSEPGFDRAAFHDFMRSEFGRVWDIFLIGEADGSHMLKKHYSQS